MGLSRDSWRHPPQRAQRDQTTSQRIVELAHERRRFGYRRIADLLLARLCGRETARAIGADQSVGVLPKVLLSVLLAGARFADGVGRLFVSDFSLTRLLTRVLGYHLLTQLLMAQTRPLALPDALLNTLADTLAGWSDDARHGALLNHLED